MIDDDPVQAYLKTRQPPATTDDPVAAYLATKKPVPAPASHNGVPFVDAKPDDEPSYASQALGGIASLARDIPGAEAAQSAVRAVVRRQPYAQARNDIRGAEESAPSVVRNANRFVGGTIAALATPGASGALQGARYGVLNGLLSSDPNKGVKDRIDDAGVQMAAGAVGGKLADVGTTAVRGVLAKSLGTQAIERKAAMTAADEEAYGLAEREARGKLSPKALADALNAKDVAPYAKEIRQSRTFAGADDATTLREAYKLMSERQGLLAGRIRSNDFKAGTSLEQKDLSLAKQELLRAAEQGETRHTPAITRDVPAITQNVPPITTAQSPHPTTREAIDAFHARQGAAATRAVNRDALTVEQRHVLDALDRRSAEAEAGGTFGSPPGEQTIELAPAHTEVVSPARTEHRPPVMPSFRNAVEQHATMAGERDAFRESAGAAGRIARNNSVAPRNLDKNSPEAFTAKIKDMNEATAKVSRDAVLGALKKNQGLVRNTVTGKTNLNVLGPASRLAPYLRALDTQAGGNPIADALRAAGISQLTPSGR